VAERPFRNRPGSQPVCSTKRPAITLVLAANALPSRLGVLLPASRKGVISERWLAGPGIDRVEFQPRVDEIVVSAAFEGTPSVRRRCEPPPRGGGRLLFWDDQWIVRDLWVRTKIPPNGTEDFY